MTVSVEELRPYLSSINEEWIKTPCNPKTRVEKFLLPGAGFFPDNLIIPRSIVSASDTNIIGRNLYEGIEGNYSMGIRSVADRPIFGGGKLNWDLEIDTNEKVADFLKNTLPAWKASALSNNYKIEQLIIMNNPREIGTRIEHSHQFVARVAWSNYSSLRPLGPQLIMEMAMGTNNLRVLDRKMEIEKGATIRYTCKYKETGYLEQAGLQIGGEVPDSAIKDIILPVISQITDLIKDPNVRFLDRLEFFAGVGLDMVEFQGFIDKKTGLVKMFIYGLRGNNDETVTGLHC